MFKGPLAGFTIALLTVLLMLGTIYVADIALNILDSVKTQVANALNTTHVTHYSEHADKLATLTIIPILALTLFIIFALSAHLQKR